MTSDVTPEQEQVKGFVIQFKGRDVVLRNLKVVDAMRLAAVVQKAAGLAGISVQEIKTTDLSTERCFELSTRLLDAAMQDYDLDAMQPGPLATLVFDELERLTGIPAEELLDAEQGDFDAVMMGIWRNEMNGPFVQRAGGLIRPLIFPLLVSTGLLRQQLVRVVASLGGLLTGGDSSWFYQLLSKLGDGANKPSSGLISEPLLPTSEAPPSGQS